MPATPRPFRPVTLVLVLALPVLAAPGAAATTKTWTGTSDPNWSSGGNWSPAGAPVAGDDLVFPGGASNLSSNNDLAVATSFRSITFTGASGGYTLGGNLILLGVGGITANNTSGFNVIALDITIEAPQTFDLTAEVDINGALDLATSDLTVNGSAATSFFQGAITGIGTLTKTGTATLVFAGTSPNTQAGRTVINGGTLRLNKPAGVIAVNGPLDIGEGGGPAFVRLAHDEQIGDLARVTIFDSGTLDFATFGVATESIGVLYGSGSVDLGPLGVLVITDGNSSEYFYGVISGGGSVKVVGGIQVFYGANTHTGPTTIMDAVLVINGSEVGPVVVANSGAEVVGTGTVATLNVPTGFMVPGWIGPGTFNVTGDAQFGAGAEFHAQLFSERFYAQLNVGGTVTLGGASLSVTLFPLSPPFVPYLGETFTIINNGGSGPIVGTFAGLPEGATFTVETTTFRISYVGWTGNDVVLTSLTGPTPTPTPSPTPTPTPRLGAVPTLSFPMSLLFALAVSAAALFLIRRAS